MFAVAGASGRVGAKTAEGLLRRGQKVRGLVRAEEKGEALSHRHAEVAVVDLFDADALTKALTGVTGAFFLLPTPPPDLDWLETSDRLVRSLVTATRAAKLGSVVLLSSVGAQHPSGTGPIAALHRAEKAFSGVAKSITFLRAAEPLEAWGPLLLDALDSGALPFAGNLHTPFPQVGAKDVGDAAAQALEEHVAGTRVVEVAGAQNWSVEDVAVVFTSLLQTRLQAVNETPEAELARLEASGLPHARAALLAERTRAHVRGLLHFAHPSEVRRGHTTLFEALATVV
jgi:uncharacterized protein YbjT (DUF2867 family)